jgi:tellurite resistance-related uncharacterized protein
VPAGLLRSHQLAPGVWEVLRVGAGTVTFVWEETGTMHALTSGEAFVIPPDTLHHVEPGDDASFAVELYR